MESIRFLVLSDTHGTLFTDLYKMLKVDVVLHCGDLTQVGSIPQFREAAKELAECNAELKLVIPGKHDLEMDSVWLNKELKEGDDPDEPKKASAEFTCKEMADQGVRLLSEGVHTFTLADSRSFRIYASPYTPAFNGYACAYEKDEDRFNEGPNPIPEGVDIVMTHGPPAAHGCELDRGEKGERLGCP
jgi:predicted MPP superfamily phosphohydrolase